MRRILIPLVILLAVSSLFAAGWKKAYFGTTPPGSWVRYADRTPDMKMTTTMTRLSDDNGRARVELHVAFENDQYPPVRNSYTLKRGFPLDRQLIDYMAQIESGSIVSGDGEPTVLDDTTVASIVNSTTRYEPVVTFAGTETVAGKETDRYKYTLHPPGEQPTTETGELWLSPAVPFGLVKQSSVTKDAKGNVTMSYERTLVDSGTKAATAEPAKSAKAATPKKSSQTLKEAYDAGLVEVHVTIMPGTHNGERAHLIIEKKDAEPLTLVVPKGKTSLHVDIPLDDFVFELASEKTFALGGDNVAELDVKQLGEQRAMDGSFHLSTYEGTPLFSGSTTVGWVKKK